MESNEAKALSALEALEARSLMWGFVDQSLSETEAETEIHDSLVEDCPDVDASEMLARLCELRVVRKFFDEGRERRYRTRIAEVIRLLQRVRQWFPGRPWQSAPLLVSDYRFDIRPRRYPKRNTTPGQALEEIQSEFPFDTLQQQIWSTFARSRPQFEFAQFQVEATRRILSMPRGAGAVVSAGTGSGKTLAFYLPAFLLTSKEVRAGSYWTKAVCIYPRQELLKDQLSEAFALSRVANLAMGNAGRRKFVLGSLFKDTPNYASPTAVTEKEWENTAVGPICPFLRCPACGGDTYWPREDLEVGREGLRCRSPGCGFVADGSEIRLTRDSLLKAPADFLFTTTEMLNQRLSDTKIRTLFGVRQEAGKQPLVTLLDEVHTYAGISGAQTALAFRRWTALLGTKMRWAALSATLPNAEQFFSDLTGVRADHVSVISPRPEDMTVEGAEYQIILRTDPASQTSTVSTSIQTIMLIARMLDADGAAVSNKLFGNKVFVFTDDLDVNNRIYDNLHDAEAYSPWRRPDPKRQPLAALRTAGLVDDVAREWAGQIWQFAQDISGSLGERLRITRTNSRDPGVVKTAQVVVATSSLEVGFNDTTVGAVVQHKAPRSSASFLQRRGRAGRERQMRPITVTVLSDYGRDRVAFQSYENLFDPTVEAQRLPLANGYVLRIQAVLATLDWLAFIAPQNVNGWTWNALHGPDVPSSAFQTHIRESLQSISKLDAGMVTALKTHLRSALAIKDELLDGVLWTPPRSLLLEVVPTAARRLFRNWKLAHGSGTDLYAAGKRSRHPLPDFAPGNLFSELMLPEVALQIPAHARVQSSVEYLPILSALQQFAPGRVRRRFADNSGNIAHWSPVQLVSGDQRIPIGTYCPRSEVVGTVASEESGVREEITLYRPWELQLANVPSSVSHASNAVWQWETNLDFVGTGRHGDVPHFGGLTAAVSDVAFWLHRAGGAASIRRFTTNGMANLRVNTQDVLVRYALCGEDGKRAAIGFAFEVDALALTLRPDVISGMAAARLTPEMTYWLRYLGLKDSVLNSPTLPNSLNYFRREWIHLVVLLAATIKADSAELSLLEALHDLRSNPTDPAFNNSIDILLTGVDPSDLEEDTDSQSMSAGSQAGSRLLLGIKSALADDSIRFEVIDSTEKWLRPPQAEMDAWLERIAVDTLAQVFLHACVIAAPSSSAMDGLIVDTVRRDGETQVVVSETTLGGGGTVESIVEVFVQDPRQLTRCMESACSASDYELAAAGFGHAVRLLNSDAEVAGAMAAIRHSESTDERDLTRQRLFGLLKGHGIPMTKTLAMMIGTRLARPGADEASDAVMARMLEEWDRLERKLGIGLPMRLAVALLSRRPEIKSDLALLGGVDREFSTAMLLMWPRAGELRQRAVQSYNPYVVGPFVDTALLRAAIFEAKWEQVAFGDKDWKARLLAALVNTGGVRIQVPKGAGGWKEALQEILGTPVSSGFLQFHPMIEAARMQAEGPTVLDLVLRERV